MNALNNLKGTTDYVPKLFDNYENLKLKVDLLDKNVKQKVLTIKVLQEQNKKYTNEIIKLQRELDVTGELLGARQKVLDAIPECELHGNCISHAMEWIEDMKNLGKENKSK